MPDALLLALPVVGGFLATMRMDLSRFKVARETGHRFYFRVVHYAVYLVAVAIAVTQVAWAIGASIGTVWPAGSRPDGVLWQIFLDLFRAVHASNLQIAILAFAGGAIANEIFNLPPGSEERYMRRAIANEDFELMVAKSLTENRAMLITLKSGQIYVGWAVRAPNPSMVRRWLRILPLASGYRDDAKQVRIQVNYAPILERVRDKDEELMRQIKAEIRPEDFEVVLSVEEIAGMHFFDRDVFKLFDPKGARLFHSDSRPSADYLKGVL